MTVTAAAVAVEQLPWSDFLARFRWAQGEHVSLIGPTGTGKTTLAIQLLPLRSYVCALGTKPVDRTLDALLRDGYERTRDDTLPERGKPPRVVHWPRYQTLDRGAKKRQAASIRDVISQAFVAGRWTLFADELSYLTRQLQLGPELVELWQQGRSIGLSVIGCTQRPRWVPLDCYSAASHLFLWRTNDDQDLRRLAGLNGADTRTVRRVVEQLPRYDVLYVDTRTGSLTITRPPAL